MLGVGHAAEASASHRAPAARSSSSSARERERGVAGRVGAAARAGAARAGAGPATIVPSREQRAISGHQYSGASASLTAAETRNSDEVRDAEVGRAGRAVDRAVGDSPQPAASTTSSQNAGQRPGRRRAERAERPMSTGTIAVQADREHREPGGVDHLLGVRAAPRRAARARRARARSPPAPAAASGRRPPSWRRTPSRRASSSANPPASAADQRADRASRARSAGVERTRPRTAASVHTNAPAGNSSQVGAEHVGERAAAPGRAAAARDQQHRLVRGGAPLVAAPARRARRSRPPPAARISRWTPVRELVVEPRAPRARCPSVSSTAPAAISGPRCGGGRSRSSEPGQAPGGYLLRGRAPRSSPSRTRASSTGCG